MEYDDNYEPEENISAVFIKLTSAYIILEMAVEEAIKVIERSYGAETPHIKAGLAILKNSIGKAREIISMEIN